MVSAIDITKPTEGEAYTVDVRNNFKIIANEITALQNAGPFMSLNGGTINGNLSVNGGLGVNGNGSLNGDYLIDGRLEVLHPASFDDVVMLSKNPTSPFEATTKQYVDAHSFVDAPNDANYYGRHGAAWTIIAPLASPNFTGVPTAPTATFGEATDQIATTAYVQSAVSAGGTFIDAPSDGNNYGRLNGGWSIVAPTNTPIFTGTPTAPTAVGGTNTTQIATTAFVQFALTPYAMTVSPALTGTPTAPTAIPNTNTTQIATTAFVTSAISVLPAVPTASNSNPIMDGTAAPGAATVWSRSDHVHPSDTSRAPINSPLFTGIPVAPTASAATNNGQIATTAFVNSFMTSMGGGGGSVSTPSANVVLTASSPKSQSYAFTAPYLSVTLPNATTLSAGGPVFSIYNAGAYPLSVFRADSSLLVSIPSHDTANLWLDANNTSAGIWHATGQALEYAYERSSGYLTFASVSPVFLGYIGHVAIFQLSTTSNVLQAIDTDTMIVGTQVTLGITAIGNLTLFQIDATHGLVIFYSGSQLRAQYITVTAPATLALGSMVSSASLTPTGIRSMGAVVVGSSYFVLYTVSTDNAGIILSVSGSTLTWGSGTAMGCGASGAGFVNGGLGSVVVLDSSRVFCITTTIGPASIEIMSISGNTVIANTGTQLSVAAAYVNRLSPTLFVIGGGTNTYLASISGTTITLGAALATATSNVTNVFSVNDTSMIVTGTSATTASSIAYVTFSGVTQTLVGSIQTIPGVMNSAGTQVSSGGTVVTPTTFSLGAGTIFHPTVGTVAVVNGTLQIIQCDPFFKSLVIDITHGVISDGASCALIGLEGNIYASTKPVAAFVRSNNGVYTIATFVSAIGFNGSASGPGPIAGQFLLVGSTGLSTRRVSLWQVAT